MRVATAAEIAEIDRLTEEEHHVPRALLMENAGRWVAAAARDVPAPRGSTCVVLAGKGSNGGDGLVAARYLALEGWRVTALLIARDDEIHGDARRNLSLARTAGVELVPVMSTALAGARAIVDRAQVVVDAIFGTGFRGTAVGLSAHLIEAANRAPAPVIAVDIPSGVEADTGAVRGPAIRAAATVTMGLPKIGLLLYPGAEHAGRIHVVDIGHPQPLLENTALRTQVVTAEMVAAVLPARQADSHKGSYGRLVICGGSIGFTGAPSLCALGALRAGAGLVTLAVPQAVYPIIAARALEAMPHPLPDDDGAVAEEAWESLAVLAAGADVIAAGPGLSARPGAAALIRRLVTEARVPLVLDADALNALARGDRETVTGASTPRILTPHPGEMARLLGTSAQAIQEDRLGAAREAARRFDAVVVLKGAHTIVAAPDGEAFIVTTGNPGMATGGMGDVLTGVIAALIGQRLPPLTAAWAGAYLHGLAGDVVAERLGDAGLLAREVADAIPLARRALPERRRRAAGPLPLLL